MVQRQLLEMIWRGSVTSAHGSDDAKLARMYRALVPVPTVVLSAQRGVDRVAVLLDEVELMPELPLGDVLVEELGVEVPYGSLVILREAAGQAIEHGDDDLSYDLGLLVAETLLTIIRSGLFPMEQETNALYYMACSYDRLIESSGFLHMGVIPSRFREGMAGALGAYWSGVRDCRAEASGLFDRADFLYRPQLLGYLQLLDGSFHGRKPGTIPLARMHFPGGVRTFQEWMAEVGVAVGPMVGEGEEIRHQQYRKAI